MYEVPKPSQVYLRPQETDDEETPVVIHSQNKYQLAEQWQQVILNLLRVNMSYLFDSTPSPLPIANPPHVQSSTIGRNNFEAAKSSRSRLKERVSEPNEERTARHRINNPKRQEHLGFADTREIAHSNRKDELKTVLNPILADGVNHLVILCWGDKDCCHIVPVNIGNEADEVNAWESIREAWYERRGNWRKYIPFYGVRQVDVVELTLAGYSSACLGRTISKAQYVGLYRMDSRRSEIEKNIANYQQQEFPCPYDSSTGMVNCFYDSCVSYMVENTECPEKLFNRSQRQLLHHARRPLLTQAFSNANIARSNNLLKGEGVIYSHRDILNKLDTWHVPDLSEIPLHGLLVTEGWTFDIQHAIVPMAVSFFFLLIVASKVIYRDWGIVWNVGCFFVSLAGLLLAWINHAVRR